MNFPLRIPRKARLVFSKLGSLLLLFQRSPIVQIILPEARVMGTSGVGELVKWSVATVAGLGAYDTVAGATSMTQIAPTPVVSPVPATTGVAFSMTVQATSSQGNPKSWSISSGSLPVGLVRSSVSTTCTLSGIPTTAGSKTFTLTAWENSNNSGASVSKSFTINVVQGAAAPAVVSSPASITINSGTTTTLSATFSGTPVPTYQWYRGAKGLTTSPVAGATSASFTTPTLTANTSYWVRATNSAGSADSNAATVTVRFPPAFTTQPVSTTIATGNSSTLTVAVSGTSPTLQWYRGDRGDLTNPIAGATGLSFTTPALAVATSYWVKATNLAGTANSDTATITVADPAQITSQPASVNIVSGNTTTLSVSVSGATPAFQWYVGESGDQSNPVSGAESATFTTPVLTTPTNYWVEIYNSVSDVFSNTATVGIITAPVITTQPLSGTVAVGTTATLTATASGTAPGFQWYAGNTGDISAPVDGATLSSFTTPALSTESRFWVRASNAAGDSDSNTAVIAVATPPGVTTQPAAATINSGATATLSVVASGTSPSYQWYVGNAGDLSSPIEGATLATFTTPPLASSTTYWVKVSNAVGTAQSDAATVTVIVPPLVITQPLSTVVSAGGSIALVVETSGSPAGFQWYEGETGDTSLPIPGATSATFTTPPLNSPASYWVRATNAAGFVDSHTAVITVDNVIAPQITAQPVSVSINSGNSTSLSVTATGTAPVYQWYSGEKGDTSNPIASAKSSSFTTPALTSTTSYWVRVSNFADRADSETATVSVVTGPVVTTQPVSISISSGSTTTLTAAFSGTNPGLQWYQGEKGDTSNPVSGATSASFLTPVLATDTRYWVRASNSAGTADSDSALVSVVMAPVITTQPTSVSIASGATADLSAAASGTAPAYQWYRGNRGDTSNPVTLATAASFTTPPLTATETYWVRASNLAGDADSDAATVSVFSPVGISTQPASVVIKKGLTASLSVAATGTSPLFQWYAGNRGNTTQPVAGATSATFVTPALNANASYWVRVSNIANAVDSNTATISIGTPAAISKQPASVTIKKGARANLSVIGTGTGLTYQWYAGASGVTTKPISKATAASYKTPALTKTTKYWVKVKNAFGFVNSKTVTVTVK